MRRKSFLAGFSLIALASFIFSSPLAVSQKLEAAKKSASSLLSEALPKKLILPDSVLSKVDSFEPSGALFLNDLNEYLVVSDDTNEKDAPLLFAVKSDGTVQNSILEIEGLKKMTDMESIFQDSKGRIYVMSSQGLSKKGKDSKKRNLFVQLGRVGKKMALISEI